jgi:DNA-binding MarR family transcriptional regulator
MSSPLSRSFPRGGLFSRDDYESLAEFRYRLARFLRRRKNTALAQGLQPQQYELLLAASALPAGTEPTIKEIASQLCLEHHTVVELADRMEKRGLLARRPSLADRRVVLLDLTRTGRDVLNRIVQSSFGELRAEGPELIRSLRRILQQPKRL